MTQLLFTTPQSKGPCSSVFPVIAIAPQVLRNTPGKNFLIQGNRTSHATFRFGNFGYLSWIDLMKV